MLEVENEHYGLRQFDIYQLNAYGQTYLGGTGDLFLIYPRTPGIPAFGKPFRIQADLRLHVLAIDSEDGSADLLQSKKVRAAWWIACSQTLQHLVYKPGDKHLLTSLLRKLQVVQLRSSRPPTGDFLLLKSVAQTRYGGDS